MFFSNLLLSGSSFTPLSLFAAGEQGGWYDPSDLSTLYQDSAGTTPVTAVEQPVGLIRDKSGRGNHLSQSTSTARPVLSARVNLLTYTEDFTNAAWITGGSNNLTVSANAITAPDGTTSADLVYPTATGSFAYANQQPNQTGVFTLSVYAKAAGKNVVWVYLKSGAESGNAYFDISDQTTQIVAGSASTFTANISAVGNGWYRLTATASASLAITGTAGAGFGVCNAKGSLAVTKNGTDGVYLWGADLRPANVGVGLPAYQRVGAATAGTSSAAGTGDYDTTGFPYYLRWDGTDDGMATGAIDFSGTDKIAVVAGARKLSATNGGIIADLSADPAGSNGTFTLSGPSASGAADYFWRSRGTSSGSGTTSGSYAEPITNVLTGQGAISTDTSILRVNGVQALSVTADQGTGNFGNHPLYVGRRGGTTLPFNGHIYGLVIVGRALTAAEISNMETWMNAKTRAY